MVTELEEIIITLRVTEKINYLDSYGGDKLPRQLQRRYNTSRVTEEINYLNGYGGGDVLVQDWWDHTKASLTFLPPKHFVFSDQAIGK